MPLSTTPFRSSLLLLAMLVTAGCEKNPGGTRPGAAPTTQAPQTVTQTEPTPDPIVTPPVTLEPPRPEVSDFSRPSESITGLQAFLPSEFEPFEPREVDCRSRTPIELSLNPRTPAANAFAVVGSDGGPRIVVQIQPWSAISLFPSKITCTAASDPWFRSGLLLPDDRIFLQYRAAVGTNRGNRTRFYRPEVEILADSFTREAASPLARGNRHPVLIENFSCGGAQSQLQGKVLLRDANTPRLNDLGWNPLLSSGSRVTVDVDEALCRDLLTQFGQAGGTLRNIPLIELAADASAGTPRTGYFSLFPANHVSAERRDHLQLRAEHSFPTGIDWHEAQDIRFSRQQD